MTTLGGDEHETLADALWRQLLEHLANGARRVLLLGAGATRLEIASRLRHLDVPGLSVRFDLDGEKDDVVVICDDHGKEHHLRTYAAHHVGPPPQMVIAGTGHLDFLNDEYAKLDQPALVPSYATGYPNTRIHIYQCLEAAARLGLTGAVVELGAFKGGTTAWLARVVQHLGLESRVIGFDSWDGFPARRSPLDMYEHPRCVFRDVDAVRAYVEPFGVELVDGDISDTCTALEGVPVLLCFVDTDNYSPARAALEVVADNVVRGGAIVFDHYTTEPEFLYTLGERMAGQDVLRSRPFLNLHDTGVFLRL